MHWSLLITAAALTGSGVGLSSIRRKRAFEDDVRRYGEGRARIRADIRQMRKHEIAKDKKFTSVLNDYGLTIEQWNALDPRPAGATNLGWRESLSAFNASDGRAAAWSMVFDSMVAKYQLKAPKAFLLPMSVDDAQDQLVSSPYLLELLARDANNAYRTRKVMQQNTATVTLTPGQWRLYMDSLAALLEILWPHGTERDFELLSKVVGSQVNEAFDFNSVLGAIMALPHSFILSYRNNCPQSEIELVIPRLEPVFDAAEGFILQTAELYGHIRDLSDDFSREAWLATHQDHPITLSRRYGSTVQGRNADGTITIPNWMREVIAPVLALHSNVYQLYYAYEPILGILDDFGLAFLNGHFGSLPLEHPLRYEPQQMGMEEPAPEALPFVPPAPLDTDRTF